MSENRIKYQNGYKYKLFSKYRIAIPISGVQVDAQEYSLSIDGELVINKSYVWNGATLWFDTNESIRATLVHDVLYQMMQNSELDIIHKKAVDLIFYNIMIEDGVPKFVAKLMYYAVKKFGKKVIKQGNKDYLMAP